MNQDHIFMEMALRQAAKAAAIGEVPIGAVVIGPDNQLLAEGFNQSITLNDPSAHAEMQAIRQAASRLANYRLSDCTLYVSLEPCAMCMGAILHSRIKRVVFAASDPKTGACGSVISLQSEARLNHHCTVTQGVLAEQAAIMLKDFFKARRLAKKSV
ncbi:MAG: tRNA adenosine(34) deaminase TadA [Alcaligenaceae bacterium]|nr:tRNA adenosine(34) deaminase TadA [Alcaligenaceae bacterium]